MNADTEPMPFEASRLRRRVTFDPSINLGHILTFCGFLATGSVAYFDLRERISVGEIRRESIAADLAAEKVRNQNTIIEMRDDIKEVRRGVNDILRSLPKGK